ncbi:MAG: hypothetical protein IH991_11690 [Planctomycetes bacterium]|nr:hypothetical protein [Planctomycetota bacterium]
MATRVFAERWKELLADGNVVLPRGKPRGRRGKVELFFLGDSGNVELPERGTEGYVELPRLRG